MKLSVIIILILCFYTNFGKCLNILGLFPHPGKSHFKVFEPLLQELARKGHNITVISPFPQEETIVGYNDISLKNDIELIVEYFDMDKFKKSIFQYYKGLWMIASIGNDICDQLKSDTMQKFLKNDDKFDLILTEIFNNDCFLGFVHKYKVPFIGLSSITIPPYSNVFFGNPGNPSYIPVPFLPYTDHMNFWERLENTVNYIYTEILYKVLIEGPQDKAAKEYFGNDLPSLHDIQKNISLFLLNSHFTYNLPRPLVPNVIEVGGVFIRKPKKLPNDIEKFINNSEHGVIYFSMGSMIKSSTFPEEKRNLFLKSFSKLKQRVLWKYDNETMPNKPGNVMIQKWMPQSDILCHPKVIAFISHGGLLGTTESVHCGVPMVVMPQYGDQFTNAKHLENKGIGETLDLITANEDSIIAAINKILQPSVQKRAKDFSIQFRDRPQDPLETAIYWVEYVAKYNGATQLRTASVDMPLYQYLLLDVILFIAFVILLIININYYILKCLFKCIFKMNNNKHKIH